MFFYATLPGPGSLLIQSARRFFPSSDHSALDAALAERDTTVAELRTEGERLSRELHAAQTAARKLRAKERERAESERRLQ